MSEYEKFEDEREVKLAELERADLVARVTEKIQVSVAAQNIQDHHESGWAFKSVDDAEDAVNIPDYMEKDATKLMENYGLTSPTQA